MTIQKLACLCLTLLGVIAAHGASYNGDAMKLKQPDGSTVEVKLFGTEHFMRGESPDGYTLIVDPNTNWICYAREDAGGQLVSSGIHYSDTHVEKKSQLVASARAQSTLSKLQEMRIEKKLRYSKRQRDEIIRKVKQQISPAPGDGTSGTSQPAVQAAPAVTGTIYQLAILIDFPDRPANIPLSSINDAFNASTYNDPRSSVKTWSSTISNNMVTLETYVIGYYRARNNTSYYLRNATFDYSSAFELRNEALPWADSQFNFAQLTATGGVVKSINFLYTGDVVSNGWANSLWPHASSYSYRTQDGVSTGAYFMSNIGNANPIAGLKTIRHELGHSVFGWADTYDYEYDSFSGGGFAMETDIPCAPFRAKHGWINVININNVNQNYSLPDNANTALRYNNPNNGNEYFMVEYVRKQGWRANAPDEGLLIWHIDEAGNNSLQDMTASRHYAHSVEQADGLFELERNLRNGSPGDLFRGGYRTLFDNTTTPNSSWWNGSASGLKISNIGVSGGADMTLTVGSGSGGGGGGGGTTQSAATMTSPAPGSTLSGTSVTFNWTSSAQTYWIDRGSSAGGFDLYRSGEINSTSHTISNLPSNGSPVYIRLSTVVNGQWQTNNYTYTGYNAGGGGGGGGGSSSLAAITSPAPGSKLTSTSVTFQWTKPAGATNFDLVLSSANGTYGDLLASSPRTSTSVQVNNLPSDGRTINATLWTLSNGQWKSQAYTYTATTATAQSYLSNSGFENGMASWSTNFNTSADFHQTNHPYQGSYNLAHYSTASYEVMTYQAATNLPNGTYKASVWIKSTGGQSICDFYVYGYNAANFSEVKAVNVPAASTYRKLEITNIQVTNGQCTVAVYSKAPAYTWATFDNFELVRQ